MILALWLGFGLGCKKKSDEAAGAGNGADVSESSAPVTYAVTGRIIEIEPGKRTIVIRHDEIPGYMRAMKMPFEAKDAAVFEGLEAGQDVQFKLHVVPKDSWVDSFEVLSEASVDAAGADDGPVLDDPRTVSTYKAVPELDPGDILPGYTLTNQLGQVIRTSDFEGKVLALTFIFTRCPLPNFCPRMSDRFAEAQALLKESADGLTNWHLLSVSFDPTFDTPRVLLGYGRRYKNDPERWSLAVGAYEEIQPLGSHFGLYFSRDVTPANLNHNLRTVVIDPKGRVHSIFIGNEWTAEELVAAMREAGAPSP
jgi:protein SCO1